MSRRLDGKGCIVLGAAGVDNMGQVIARRFAAEGGKVLVAGRHAGLLESLADELGGFSVTCDITDKADIEKLGEIARRELGQVEVAVNATGWGFLKPFEMTTTEELRKMTDLQFIGPFQFFQVMVSVMEKGGSIIQISSAVATIMLNDHAAYMGTKAGTDHIVRCVANELGHKGIRANSISPGLTETPMTTGAKGIPGLWEAFQARYPLGRVGTSGDIAAAAVWLASDECFMTGQNLQVNGGLTLRNNPTREEIDAEVFKRTGKPRPQPWDVKA